MSGTRKLVYIAVLTALALLANIFTVPLSGSNFLSFTYTVCFLAGAYLGIPAGIAVGFLGDLLAHFIRPFGEYNVCVGISSLLLGLIPAVIFRLKCPQNRTLKLIVSFVLCGVVCTMGLNTVGLWLVYGAPNGKSFFAYLALRLPFQAIMVVTNAVICFVLLKFKLLDRMLLQVSLEEAEKSDTIKGEGE